jgi:hypothetical protein
MRPDAIAEWLYRDGVDYEAAAEGSEDDRDGMSPDELLLDVLATPQSDENTSWYGPSDSLWRTWRIAYGDAAIDWHS